MVSLADTRGTAASTSCLLAEYCVVRAACDIPPNCSPAGASILTTTMVPNS